MATPDQAVAKFEKLQKEFGKFAKFQRDGKIINYLTKLRESILGEMNVTIN